MYDNNSYSTISFYEISGVVISGSCVGTYGPSNYIASPNYPQEYGNDIDCRWLISSPGIKNLTLKFLDLEYILRHHYLLCQVMIDQLYHSTLGVSVAENHLVLIARRSYCQVIAFGFTDFIVLSRNSVSEY